MKIFIGSLFILTTAFGCTDVNKIARFSNKKAPKTNVESASTKGPTLVSQKWLLDHAGDSSHGFHLYLLDKTKPEDADYIEKIERSGSHSGNGKYLVGVSHNDLEEFLDWGYTSKAQHSDTSFSLSAVRQASPVRPRIVVAQRDQLWNLERHRKLRTDARLPPVADLGPLDAVEEARLINIVEHRRLRSAAGLPQVADLGPMDAEEEARLTRIEASKIFRRRNALPEVGVLDPDVEAEFRTFFQTEQHKLLRGQAKLPWLEDPGPMDATEEARLLNLKRHYELRKQAGLPHVANIGPLDDIEEARLRTARLEFHRKLRAEAGLPEIADLGPMDTVEEARLNNIRLHRVIRRRAEVPEIADLGPMDAVEEDRLDNIWRHRNARRRAGLPEIADLGPMDAVEQTRLRNIGENIRRHREMRQQAGLPQLADLGPMDAVEQARLRNILQHRLLRMDAGLPQVADLDPMDAAEEARLRAMVAPDFIERLLAAPVGPAPAAAAGALARGLDVHSPGRDARTQAIVRRFMEENLDKGSLDVAFRAFETYLQSLRGTMASGKWNNIQLTLNNSSPNGFQGLLNIENMVGTGRSGRSFLGALYKFADGLADEKDREAAKISIISALNDNFEDGAVLCPYGQSQHFITSVLQGRVAYARLDDEEGAPLTDGVLSNLFFTRERQAVDAIQLRAELEEFMRDSPLVNRAQLERLVEAHIAYL